MSGNSYVSGEGEVGMYMPVEKLKQRQAVGKRFIISVGFLRLLKNNAVLEMCKRKTIRLHQ